MASDLKIQIVFDFARISVGNQQLRPCRKLGRTLGELENFSAFVNLIKYSNVQYCRARDAWRLLPAFCKRRPNALESDRVGLRDVGGVPREAWEEHWHVVLVSRWYFAEIRRDDVVREAISLGPASGSSRLSTG